MIIIVYSETNSALIEQNLGKPEYSYYFVLKAFLPILQQLGSVVIVTEPDREVDPIYRRAAGRGEDCVFLSFSPPHRTPDHLACPTIPVFAWEYDTIPSDTWFGERHQDWRFVLNKLGRGITHSTFSVDAVQSAIGSDFPIVSIPAPIFDRLKKLRALPTPPSEPRRHAISVSGRIIDTRNIDLSAYSRQDVRPGTIQFARGKGDLSAPLELQLDGVIYTTMLDPYAGRKNYFDMLCGFCWALRDFEDATLIFKLSHHDVEDGISYMMENIYKLSPFKCRVILIDSYLSDDDYEKLLMATTYVVNTSQAEGQCLPLMECMSVGKPAVAPRHTGMIDYLSTENAFLVATTGEPGPWPHDPRGAFRVLHRRIDFESLLGAFQESYSAAKERPEQYNKMAVQAEKALEAYCSDAVTLERLSAFLVTVPREATPSPEYGKLNPPQDTYSLGRMIDFATEFDARKYLHFGWAGTELGLGVWSHGPAAQLSFRIERRPTKPLLLRVNLSAFVVPEHPTLTVRARIEGLDIAQWTFSIEHPESIHGSWREAAIPAEVAWNRAFYVTLQIIHPASPRNLGLSGDTRSLGVMLHKLSISL